MIIFGCWENTRYAMARKRKSNFCKDFIFSLLVKKNMDSSTCLSRWSSLPRNISIDNKMGFLLSFNLIFLIRNLQFYSRTLFRMNGVCIYNSISILHVYMNYFFSYRIYQHEATHKNVCECVYFFSFLLSFFLSFSVLFSSFSIAVVFIQLHEYHSLHDIRTLNTQFSNNLKIF